MRVLLLGGTGLLSGAAARAFVKAGHEVTVVTRGERPLAAGVQLLPADRTDARMLAAALTGERFDFTVDFLAYQGADVEPLLRAPGFEPGRLVEIGRASWREGVWVTGGGVQV